MSPYLPADLSLEASEAEWEASAKVGVAPPSFDTPGCVMLSSPSRSEGVSKHTAKATQDDTAARTCAEPVEASKGSPDILSTYAKNRTLHLVAPASFVVRSNRSSRR